MNDTAHDNSHETELVSFENRVGPTMKAASDKPEFLATEALIPKTTTTLDTNPVLSNISIPTSMNINSKHLPTNSDDRKVQYDDDHTIDSHTSQLNVDDSREEALEPYDGNTTSVYHFKKSPLHKKTQPINSHTRSLTFSLNNDANFKRSSIYESKSTVTAIPIRNPININRQNFWDNEDVISTKSVSSSMTASLSKSSFFGLYNNQKKHKQNTKGLISKEYWMKDDSAKDCFTCGKAFNTFRRRHHCRICGQIFCNSCTLSISGETFGLNGRMRVCNNCYAHADNYEDSSDEESCTDQQSHYNNDDRLVFSTQESPPDDINGDLNERSIYASDSDLSKQQDVILINEEDAQSIMTTAEDSKLFLSTPPPPPKMAIPATRQGESLEISFPSHHHRTGSWHGESGANSNGGVRDRYTIKDVDMLSSFKQHYGSPSQAYNKPGNKMGKHSLRRSLFSYVGNNRPPLEKATTAGNVDSIIGNVGSKNFKFEFNYMKSSRRGSISSERREVTPQQQQQTVEHVEEGGNHISSRDEETSEDEGSMSIYSSLNDTVHSSNPIRSTRASTKSFQRAEASLQRMRFRRKSKSKSSLRNPDSLYKGLTLLNNSTPNLISVVSEDKAFAPSSSSTSSIKPSKTKTGNTGPWRRVTSISGFLMPPETKNELSEVSSLHMEALLKQVLNDQNFEKPKEWAGLLRDFLRKIQNITLNAKDSSTLDFRQNYVKIKRISGGHPSSSEYINGVVFSKALPCKNMPRLLETPRILLIMFPLEYQRSENHFLSIETVFAQEREYLDKLVSRLTSLSPDIIFVGASVSGYALELLNKSGVVVQFNVKPQVIERIAKLTEADIAISVDKLAANVKMGECERFEVKSFVFGNVSKTYTFIIGCNPSLGGTMLLRGATSEHLRKLKDVSEFMVYAVFSLKLESSFFSDNFLQLSSTYYLQEKCRKKDEKAVGYFAEFLEKFGSRILTVSPTVEFPVPFLLKRARELEYELLEKKKETENLQLHDKTGKAFGMDSLAFATTLTQRDFTYLIKFVHEKELEDLELQFQKRSRHWEVSYAQSRNLLGTGSHQCITVLYSMVSTKTATPCIGPQLVTIDYFWDSDISIGQFIENVIATALYPCRQGCGGLLKDHYRSYVHGSGKVDVLIENFQTRLPKLKDIIFTWSYCKKCGTSTPILQMSEKTWNYSFGKFLEVMFWSKKDSVAGIGNCTHDFAKEHVKYFGFNDLVARMEYSDLEVYELVTPPRKITWTPYKDIKMKVELYYQILDKINSFYDSVLNRLSRVKLDSISGNKLLAGQTRIEELKTRVEDEKKVLIDDLEKLYRDYPGDKHIQLNITIKALHDRAVSWDSEFTEFGRMYLPSENDITRITSHQLKKLFSDFGKHDDNSVENQKSESNNVKPIEPEFPEEIIEAPNEDSFARDLKDNNSDINVDDNSSITSKACKNTTIAKPVGGQVGDLRNDQADNLRDDQADNLRNDNNCSLAVTSSRPRIHRTSSSFKKSFNKGVVSDLQKRSSIISSASSSSSLGKEHNVNSKVGQLANFFDQMHFDALSKEFELQREKERIQLNKNNHPALRLHTSTPIVEIYKNVKDAVDEPLHDLNNVGGYESTSNKGDASDKVLLGSTQRKRDENLESQLENSIHQWGERVLHKDIKNTTEPASIVVSTDGKDVAAIEPLPPIMTTANANKDGSSTQPEKSLLMKALANFWADRSASLWKPLDYPTLPTEHIFVDSDVIIREDEPSSLIAFCLSTSDYKQKMVKLDLQRQCNIVPNDSATGTIHVDSSNVEKEPEHAPELADIASQTHPNKEEINSIHADAAQKPLAISPDSPSTLEAIMTKKTAVHLRYQFEDALTVMSCKIFFAEHFDAFRRICGCDDKFIQSLSRCVKWDSSGGKSGSGFLKTLDDRFVIKELSHAELDPFVKFTPSYFEYMAQAMFHDLPTALAKVFGFYQIQVKSSISGSKSYKMDVIIMENLFYEKKTSRIFDLKGSMRNRHVEQTGRENEVLLDENMIEYIYESPIHVREYDKKLLRASLWNDTLFLAKMNVMDYSLVVGMDNKGHTLTVGIIDFIRTFTWDKKLENWMKEKGLVGGNTTKKPTVVTPKQYKNRFREAMERYILMVPDPWYQENT